MFCDVSLWETQQWANTHSMWLSDDQPLNLHVFEEANHLNSSADMSLMTCVCGRWLLKTNVCYIECSACFPESQSSTDTKSEQVPSNVHAQTKGWRFALWNFHLMHSEVSFLSPTSVAVTLPPSVRKDGNNSSQKTEFETLENEQNVPVSGSLL